MDCQRNLIQPVEQIRRTEFRQMKQPKAEKVDKPDGSLAWRVAFAACLINFIMAGLGRMSGILYVGFIEMFGITRGQAMTPFSVRSSTRNLLGPVVGILGQEYGVRAVSIMGGVIGAVSSASCFFAPDINWITFIWGGINGVGTALTTTLPQVTIGQYFKKYHTTAAGLAFSGGCVGAFLFPVLIEYLLHHYGLHGTFLTMAGITMHVIPASMILRKPPWMRSNKAKKHLVPSNENLSIPNADNSEKINDTMKVNGHANGNGIAKVNYVAIESGLSLLNVDNDTKGKCSIGQDITFHDNQNLFSHTLWQAVKFLHSSSCYISNDCHDLNETKLNTTPSEAMVLNFLCRLYGNTGSQSTIDNSEVLNVQSECTDVDQSENLKNVIENALMEFKKDQVIEGFLLYMKSTDSVFLQLQTPERLRFLILKIVANVEYRKLPTEECSVLVNVDKSTFDTVNTSCSNQIRNPGFKEHIKTAIKLNLNPIFHMICLCRTIHFITFIPVVTVVVDFSMDKGLPEEDGKYIIAALSAGDLIGRLGLGWITDAGYMVVSRYMLLGMVIQGATTATLPLMNAKWAFFCAIGVFGMLQGSLFIRHPILVAKYMHPDEQPIAMGCINFLSGFVGFGLPACIGYFRDTLGSYDHMFHITGALGIAVGLLWIFEPQFIRWIDRRQPDDSTQER